ncbi:hypothetical protein PPL_02421 [Heterostelium album PN500]|uniref:Myotubularin phosphatase domain-containing protein n=1 Tax=Heterostelium pallidum (strain ATCC 26659 / Pp 5 / PN500) TaxID=670386 RepID=D3AZN8_HETP5|nr:hypothetical protein PPL_02421 [Heterostelium album PN500]EFA85417.1 hypothetical protein PPL_02421 [Heterostelium album PN500]|eukprot:XP_020437526.1 hypothetical protein PPL_02421 [Heterostelium album PN500]
MTSISPLHTHHPLGSSDDFNHTNNNNNNHNNIINGVNNSNSNTNINPLGTNNTFHNNSSESLQDLQKQQQIQDQQDSGDNIPLNLPVNNQNQQQQQQQILDMNATTTSLSYFLHNHDSHQGQYHQFKTYCKQLGDIIGYESGLFASLKTSGNNTVQNNNNNNIEQNNNNQNNSDNTINSSDNTSSNNNSSTNNLPSLFSSTNSNNGGTEPVDFNSRMTVDLFDKVEDYILAKLESEFAKFKQQQLQQQLQQIQQQQQQQQQLQLQLQQQQQNIDPLSPLKDLDINNNNNNHSNNNNNNNNNVIKSNVKKVDLMILPGEALDKESYPVYYTDNLSNETIPSILFTSNFRIIFVSKLTMTESFSVPLTTIYRIDRLNSFKVDQLIGIWCKDFRKVEFFIIPREVYPFSEPAPQHDHTAPLIGRLRHIAFPTDPLSVFAFKFSPPPLADPINDDGWRTYDLFSEFIRQELNFKLWRTSEVNCEYASPTYPARLVVPDSITDDELRIASGFRSKGRLPTVCWVSRSGVPLARSSQPMVGITRARCAEDEKLVELIRKSCPSNLPLHLLDARPKANAIGNFAKGMGYEMSYNCNIEFLGIGNIHAMRDSINRLELLVHGTSTPSVDDGWLSQLEATKWLDHIRAVLLGATRAVELIQSGHPVLLHCSDGWDRTSQLSSLSLLLLDPYYRTIRGFQVLIEKEWLSFGHMFGNRVRHGDRNFYADSQRSPVFQQFMDCVHQMQVYYHDMFEFNEQYLIAILDALYSCQYGTFLCNTERERSQLKNKTVSLWTHLNTIKDQFLNPFYNAEKTAVPSPLPVWRGEYVQLWRNYYYRYSRQPSKEPLTFEKIATSLKTENNDLRSRLLQLKQQVEMLQQQQKSAASSSSNDSTTTTTTNDEQPPSER